MQNQIRTAIAAAQMWRCCRCWRGRPIRDFIACYRITRYLLGEPRRVWETVSQIRYWEAEVPGYGAGIAMTALLRVGPAGLAELTAAYKAGSDDTGEE